MNSPLRTPPEETVDLYPGLVVWDARVTGSITFGQSRLPIWAIFGELREFGWDGVLSSYPQVTEYGWDEEKFFSFLYYLCEARGELGRLLLVIADVERRSRAKSHDGWWTKRDKKVLAAALRAALACVEE